MRVVAGKLSWMRRLAFIAALLVSVATPLAAEPPGTAAHRVVIELTSEDAAAWDAALDNIDALQQHLRPATIEVVVHGRAIARLENTKDGAIHSRMKRAAEAGVTFAACENAMRKHRIDRSELVPYATTVSSGVVEVVTKQERGWSYLRSGS